MQPTAVSSHTPGLTGCTHTTHTHTRFASGAGGGRARHELPDGRVTSRCPAGAPARRSPTAVPGPDLPRALHAGWVSRWPGGEQGPAARQGDGQRHGSFPPFGRGGRGCDLPASGASAAPSLPRVRGPAAGGGADGPGRCGAVRYEPAVRCRAARPPLPALERARRLAQPGSPRRVAAQSPPRAIPTRRLPSWEEPHLRAAGDAGLVPLRAQRERGPCLPPPRGRGAAPPFWGGGAGAANGAASRQGWEREMALWGLSLGPRRTTRLRRAAASHSKVALRGILISVLLQEIKHQEALGIS